METIKNLQGNMKLIAGAVTGLVIGIVFGLLWHLVDPGLALWFWPILGALIFSQHAFSSSRRIRDRDKPESMPPTE